MKKTSRCKTQNTSSLVRALNGRAGVYHLIGKEQEALVDYDSLLKQNTDLKIRINVLAALSDINVKLGNIEKALLYSDHISAIVRRNRDIFWRGRALIIKADILRNTGDYKTALMMIKRSIAFYNDALRRIAKGRNIRRMINEGIAHAYHSVGIIHYGYGQYDSAEKYFSKSAFQMRRLGNRIAQIQSMNNIALIYWHRGFLGQAERIFSRILKMAMEMGHKSGIAYIMQNLGLVVNDMGKLHDGLDKFTRAIQYAGEIGDKGLMAINHNNIGITYERLNLFAPAYDNYKKSMELFRRIDHRPGLAMENNNIAGVLCEWHQQKKALSFIDRAISIGENGRFTDALIRSCKTKGRILALMKKYKASAAMIERSFRLAREQKMSALTNDAVIAYVGSMIIAWTDNAINYYPEAGEYAGILESIVRKESAVGEEQCLLLSILARYYAIRGSLKNMNAMVSRLERDALKVKNEYILMEIALTRAIICWRTRRSWTDELVKAHNLAQKLGSKAMLYYIRQLDNRLRQ